MTTVSSSPDPALDKFLVEKRLLPPGQKAVWQPLSGGVSSDIWRVDFSGHSLCVKRALAQLKVAAEWKAPLSRNAYEWAWLKFAARHCPANVPEPLAHDDEVGLFAMSFLDPQRHPVWKQQILDGVVVPVTAQAVGEVLGRLHAASAGRPEVVSAFETIDNFYALRLEPYLVAAANRHAEVGPALIKLVARTAGTQRALVHGDVSPKNILVGPSGPVFLDAECAWYGDPAFDLAFCLNHLLLKCLVQPARRELLLTSFRSMRSGYLSQVDWESKSSLELRAAQLLPALLLARVDGKSPVEYLTDETHRALVRAVAIPLLKAPPASLEEVLAAWAHALAMA
ncbi:phosphotransferase family protein [Aquabacterium sp.]|uniref:phosphotransferase family protein n=1 Tax=Aquabacterium sp. TaxID=1872578 RepID=UPI002BD2F7E5|nr:aminoglycoside phosphotransferase family protein [Aquabacterium sp.]HSW04480.1 aminoglycoside phosphotransferase family protein [Aquabacterium sp.]